MVLIVEGRHTYSWTTARLPGVTFLVAAKCLESLMAAGFMATSNLCPGVVEQTRAPQYVETDIDIDTDANMDGTMDICRYRYSDRYNYRYQN